jgi:hypothetical protein
MFPKIFWLASLLAPAPLCATYFYSLAQQIHYRYAVVLCVVTLALLPIRWDHHWRLPARRMCILLYSAALISLVLAIAIWSPWLSYVSFLLFFGSFLSANYERLPNSKRRSLRRGTMVYLSLPFWFALRVPLGFDDAILSYFLHVTSYFASFTLDYFNLPHYINGTVLELADKKFFVAETSGGIASLFALLACSFFLQIVRYRSPLLTPLYFFSGCLVALLLGTLRLIIAPIMYDGFTIDLTQSWYGRFFAYTTFLVAGLLLVSFDYLIAFCFAPVSRDTIHVSNLEIRNPFKLLWNRTFRNPKPVRVESSINSSKFSWIPMVTIVLLLLTLGAQIFYYGQQFLAPTSALHAKVSTAVIWNPPRALFENPKLRIESFESSTDGSDVSQSDQIDIWNVLSTSDNLRHRITISQMYPRFHDLGRDYTRAGWTLIDETTFAPTNDTPPWPLIACSAQNQAEKYSFFTYSAFDTTATPVNPLNTSAGTIMIDRVLGNESSVLTQRDCLLFHIWTTSAVPFSSEQKQQLIDLHVEMRQQVVSAYRQQLGVVRTSH